MNESNFVIAENNDTSRVDFGTLLEKLSDDPSLGLLKSHLQKLQTHQVVSEGLSPLKQTKAEREINYKATKKEVSKWIPQLQKNSTCEQLSFGDISTEIQQTMSSLSNDFQPVNDFESELKEAIAVSGVTEERVAEAKALPMAPNLKTARTNSHVAQLKAILSREQRKNRRINKIKSKMWHKVNRKTEVLERERLLSRLEEESPELAEKIRAEMEEKRAGMRMLKRQNARRKWAQVASRYGGKEMQKVVSREAQKDKDEMDAVTRIVKSKPGQAYNDDDSDDDLHLDSDSDSHDSDSAQTPTSRVLKRARSLIEKEVEDDDTEIEGLLKKRKGLMGLSFMQQALEKQKLKTKEQAEEAIQQIDTLRKSVRKKMPRNGEDYEDSDLEELEESQSKTPEIEVKKKSLPRISKEELQIAAEQLREKTEYESYGSAKVSVAASSYIDVDLSKLKKRKVQDQFKIKEDNEILKARPEECSGKSNAILISSDTTSIISGLVESLASQGVLDSALEQEALIQEAFVAGDQTEEIEVLNKLQMEDEDEIKGKEEKDKGPSCMAGWGNWTGEGIFHRKTNNEKIKSTPRTPPKAKVYINRKLDRKLAPYFVNQLPNQYSNKEQFEANRSHPLGPEWNTMQVHKRFIQPEVIVRAGTVIMPLEYAKHLPKEQADSLLDMWSEKGKKHAPKAKL